MGNQCSYCNPTHYSTQTKESRQNLHALNIKVKNICDSCQSSPVRPRENNGSSNRPKQDSELNDEPLDDRKGGNDSKDGQNHASGISFKENSNKSNFDKNRVSLTSSPSIESIKRIRIEQDEDHSIKLHQTLPNELKSPEIIKGQNERKLTKNSQKEANGDHSRINRAISKTPEPFKHLPEPPQRKRQKYATTTLILHPQRKTPTKQAKTPQEPPKHHRFRRRLSLFSALRKNQPIQDPAISNLKKKSELFLVEEKSPKHPHNPPTHPLVTSIVQPDGSHYRGTTKNKKKHGKGTLLYKDGSKYVGEWFEDKAHGKGKWLHKNGDTFEGELRDNKANGYGQYTFSTGFVYKGGWKDDLYHGSGEEYWEDGTVLTAEFRDGVKQGPGAISFVDGSRFEGNFVDGKISGKGVFVFKDGKRYEGDFKDGKMHGYGVCTWRDGRVYEGRYRWDLKHGYGEYRYADGRMYKGEWKEGRQHGKGVLVGVGGEEVTGTWMRGKLRRRRMSVLAVFGEAGGQETARDDK